MNKPFAIPEAHLEIVCRFREGENCCAFIGGGPRGLMCLKGTPMEQQIRNRLAAKTMMAKGDHCEGLKEGEVAG